MCISNIFIRHTGFIYQQYNIQEVHFENMKRSHQGVQVNGEPIMNGGVKVNGDYSKLNGDHPAKKSNIHLDLTG